MTNPFTLSTANFSPCEDYRYWLERKWSDAPPQAFILLNPSTANASEDDPTIRRCIKFAKREDAGGIVVVNLFAYRATKPKELDDPSINIMAGNAIGAEDDTANTQSIEMALMHASLSNRPVICAWGSNKNASKMAGRIKECAADLGAQLVCFKINKDGQPKHPLYVKGDTPLINFI